MKQTIAIIGFEENGARDIASRLAKANYPLLLFVKEENAAKKFIREIRAINPASKVITAGCEFHASWEADVILLVGTKENKAFADKIREVATRKIIISLSNECAEELKGLLPSSTIVRMGIDAATGKVTVSGDEGEALKTVMEIARDAGFVVNEKLILQ